MKKFMYLKNLTMKQFRAKERIEELENRMDKSNDLDKLFDMFCECDDIWQYNFMMESIMNPDPKFCPRHEEIFVERTKILEARAKFVSNALASVNGSASVTINITINGEVA